METRIDPETAKREFEELIKIERQLAQISVEAERLFHESGLSRSAIALKMGNFSQSRIRRLLKGIAYKASIEILAKFAWACGYEMRVTFVPMNVEDQSKKTSY